MDLSPASRVALLQIAREALRAAVERPSPAPAAPAPLPSPPPLAPPPDDPDLLQPAGCFVSLHERDTHRLRGCIGRLEASGPLWRIVAETAVNVLDDPRFSEQRVTRDELPRLTIEVSVLSPLKPCSALEFDLLADGVYLIAGERAGCFLPQVARETGWTREQLLDRLCTEKLGLPAGTWRSADVTFLRFAALIVGPEPAVIA